MLPYGHVFRLPNGLHARVLLDDPAHDTVLVSVYISGWGDPIRSLPRASVPATVAGAPVPGAAGGSGGGGDGDGVREERG